MKENKQTVFKAAKSSQLLRSSFWGMAANILQSLLLALFFVILARKYDKAELATFLIANTLYQLLAAFSTLGLGQWFTREVVRTQSDEELINKFMKMQLVSGFVFYFLNLGLAFIMYDDPLILKLSVVLGINIIFDNIIYAIKSLNIAEFRQEKTFVILFIDSILKFLAACILFIYPLNTLLLSVALIAVRFFTLNLFLRYGVSNAVNFKKLLKYSISFDEIKKIVAPNWAFLVIGSVSMVFWRIGNLIISKMLPATDVANYEVSYRVFSIALTVPLILSTTVFPKLVALHQEGDNKKLSNFFHNVFLAYISFSLLCFTFFYSFSQYLIPGIFGKEYINNVDYTVQMFLAVLVFPTVLLQANTLVAMNQEKADMWLNIAALIANTILTFVGISIFKSLAGVNLSIFLSFLLFHILQDYLLIKMKVTTLNKVLQFYVITIVIVGSYMLLSVYVNPFLLYIAFWLLVIFIIVKFVIGTQAIRDFLASLKKQPVSA